MRAIFYKNMQILKHKKGYLLFIFLINCIAIIGISFFSSMPESLGTIAVIGDVAVQEEGFEIQRFTEKPSESLLANRTYVGFVYEENDQLMIHTYLNDEMKNQILGALEHGVSTIKQDDVNENIYQTIRGFLSMIVLLESVFIIFLFTDDLAHQQFWRILGSPLSTIGYVLSMLLFISGIVCVLAFIPVTSLFLITNIAAIKIGSLYGIIVMLAVFGTSLAMLISSLSKRQENVAMLTQPLLIFTTLISYMAPSSVPWLTTIASVLPQKLITTQLGAPIITIYCIILVVGTFYFVKKKQRT